MLPNVKNKSSMELENKIKCVLMDFEINEITLQEATKRILLLLDVVGQSEQLKAFMDFAEWYKNEYKQHIPLGAIKEYIKSL